MNKDEVYATWKNQVINEKVNGWCYTPLEKVKHRLNSTGYPEKYLHYVVGDVMETLKDKTKIQLNNLKSLVAENGIFIGLVITFLSISYLLKVDLKINLNGIIEFEN